MRILACVLFFCLSAPALAQNKTGHDFGDSHFDDALVRFCGPKDKDYMTPEKEGLRLRYTGKDAAPAGNPAGVISTFKARGNFVATMRYEILATGQPAKGTGGIGVELYMMLDNPNKDGVSLVRTLNPGDVLHYYFTVRTNDAAGKRISKDARSWDATERLVKGRLRLARKGAVVVGSFAEGNDERFTEVQRSVIGTDDVRLFRFNGHSGNDMNAVLDMRILEVTVEGPDLSKTGQFATAPPVAGEPAADIVEPPGALLEQAPRTGRRLLIFALLILILVIVLLAFAVRFFLQRPKQKNDEPPRPAAAPATTSIKPGQPKGKP